MVPRIRRVEACTYPGGFERLLRSLHRLAIRHGRIPIQPMHLETGERGEDAALFHLQRQGCVVVARRWKSARQRGDLDLIAWEGDTLCFIEVKTREGREPHQLQDDPSAESAVNEDKREILRRLARLYVKTIDPAPESVRFDVVSVYLNGPQRQVPQYRAPKSHATQSQSTKTQATLFRGAFGW